MQVIQNNKPDFASLLQPALHHQNPNAVLNDPDLESKIVARVRLFHFDAKDVESITTTKPIDFFPS